MKYSVIAAEEGLEIMKYQEPTVELSDFSTGPSSDPLLYIVMLYPQDIPAKF